MIFQAIKQNKSPDLTQSKFSGKLFVTESMCHENHQLACKCCQLKKNTFDMILQYQFAYKIRGRWVYSQNILSNVYRAYSQNILPNVHRESFRG